MQKAKQIGKITIDIDDKAETKGVIGVKIIDEDDDSLNLHVILDEEAHQQVLQLGLNMMLSQTPEAYEKYIKENPESKSEISRSDNNGKSKD